MPNQKPTGTGKPQATGRQTEQPARKLPSIRADINWLNPKEDESIRASASLTIGGAFAVHGVKVTRSQSKGDFVSMPSYKKGEEYKDIFHAVTKEAREAMNAAVMQAYEQKLADQTQDQDENFTGNEPDEEQAAEPAEDAEEGQVMT
jgi:stage V sporulation protein G